MGWQLYLLSANRPGRKQSKHVLVPPWIDQTALPLSLSPLSGYPFPAWIIHTLLSLRLGSARGCEPFQELNPRKSATVSNYNFKHRRGFRSIFIGKTFLPGFEGFWHSGGLGYSGSDRVEPG